MKQNKLPKKDQPDITRPFCEFGDEEWSRYGGGAGVLAARGGGGFRNHQQGECIPTVKKARVERKGFVELILQLINDLQEGKVQVAYMQLQKGTEETTMWIPLVPTDFSLSERDHMSSLQTRPTRLLNICFYTRLWLGHYDLEDAKKCEGPLNHLLVTEVNYERDQHSRSELPNTKSIWQGSAYRVAFRYKGMCYPDGVYHIVEQPAYWTRVDPEAFSKGILSGSLLDTILGMSQDALARFMSDTS